MTEGGLGGTPSKEVIEKLSQVSSEKWQEKEYQEKQLTVFSLLLKKANYGMKLNIFKRIKKDNFLIFK